eukprot:c21172_g1_i3.p1 GENE.c21172_g1_i3~~c21172_g1_i3.p1  ORF type:complete len:121 (-),score=33.54 c21172_g1_i3:25-387(-)
MSEGSKSRIETKFHPEALECVIEYLYTHKISFSGKKVEEIALIFAVADALLLEDLCCECENSLYDCLTSETIKEVFAFAKKRYRMNGKSYGLLTTCITYALVRCSQMNLNDLSFILLKDI